jgi:hypothetical protein
MNTSRHLLAAMWLSLATAVAVASETNDISFDSSVDFRGLGSFSIRDGEIRSDKPEIDNRLFRLRMQDDIRAALVKKGLKEDTAHPAVTFTYYFYDKDVSAVERQPDTHLPGTRQPGSPPIPGVILRGGPNPVLYTEGTLVIDATDATGSLLWRGTWRDQERNGPRLSKSLSSDVRKLLSKYPPGRR